MMGLMSGFGVIGHWIENTGILQESYNKHRPYILVHNQE